jgi:hypothetical protein
MSLNIKAKITFYLNFKLLQNNPVTDRYIYSAEQLKVCKCFFFKALPENISKLRASLAKASLEFSVSQNGVSSNHKTFCINNFYLITLLEAFANGLRKS